MLKKAIEIAPGVSLCPKHLEVERHRSPSGNWYCSECNRERKSTDRGKEANRAAAARWRKKHPEKKREEDTRWRKKHPEKHRGYTARWRKDNPKEKQENRMRNWRREGINITWEQYENMEKQCAICGKASNGTKSLHVDHNHTTGEVRGLLCVKCNSALGFLNDDIILLQKATEYLGGTCNSELDSGWSFKL